MRIAKRSAAIALILALLVTAACLAMPILDGTAFASADNGTYGSYGKFADQWYYGDNALNIEGAKAAVNGWNLSALDGTDPLVIAVIDTGIDVSHEIFDGVLLTNKEGQIVGHNSTDALSADGADKEKVNISDIPSGNSARHGTEVAGVLAMLIREFGLQKYIKIYPIKANDAAQEKNGVAAFTLDNMLEAIKWTRNITVDDRTVAADVINLSFGNSPVNEQNQSTSITKWRDSSALRHELISTAENSVIVASAGNYGRDSANADHVFYPAAMQGVLSVMGYNVNGFEGSYNYGELYDIAAPCRNILTAGATVGSDSLYKQVDGTSMAAPIASFAAALMKLRYKAAGVDVPKAYTLAHYMRNLNSTISFTSRDNKAFTFKKLNLATVATQDFESTVSQVTPTAIVVTHDGQLGGEYAAQNEGSLYADRAATRYDEIFMVADQVKTVNFHATLAPYGETISDYDAMLEWVLVDSKGNATSLGRGTTLSYTAKTFGETKIICRLVTGEINLQEEIPVYVCYKDYIYGSVRVTYLANANDPKPPTSGVLYTTKKTVFTLTDLQYLDPDVPVKWYVNGKYVGEGRTYTFRPTRTGQYIIGAQYGDNPVLQMPNVAFYADVHSFIERPLDMSMVILAGVVAIGAAVTVAIIVVRRKKAAKGETEEPAKPRKHKKAKRDKSVKIAKR